MKYVFNDHLHNYAVWTAARVVQRGFPTNIKTIKNAIEYKFSKKTGYDLNTAQETAEKFYQTKKDFIFNNN